MEEKKQQASVFCKKDDTKSIYGIVLCTTKTKDEDILKEARQKFAKEAVGYDLEKTIILKRETYEEVDLNGFLEYTGREL